MFNTNDPSGQSDKSHFTFPECNTKTSSLFVVNESRCVFESTHLGIFLFKLKCKQPSWRPRVFFIFRAEWRSWRNVACQRASTVSGSTAPVIELFSTCLQETFDLRE